MRNGILLALLALPLGLATAQDGTRHPAYSVENNDTTCQIFLYSPAIREGLHLAYLDSEGAWQDVAQLCASDYGKWGKDKQMHKPFVTKAKDGTWRAVWGLNDSAPQFAAAYSEDLVTWRPQDYPILKEKGVSEPVAYQMEDGTFDIYVKTLRGLRYVHASEDFRTFKEDPAEAQADDILWLRDSANVGDTVHEGNLFEIPKIHLDYILSWFAAMEEDKERNSEQMKDDHKRFESLPETVEATLTVDTNSTKRISDRLIGIFFEDISYAADGGLYAELLQNRDFEYTGADHKGWDSTTAWELDGQSPKVDTNGPLSKNNPHYAIVSQNQTLCNEGWDGIKDRGREYDFSLYVKLLNGAKNELDISLVSDGGEVLAKGKISIQSQGWQQHTLSLNTDTKKRQAGSTSATLRITPKKKGTVAIDMVSLMPHDTYKGHGLRRDLAEAVEALSPKFVRFPGGCMLHGDGLDNIYNWKESTGKLQDRKPTKNIWGYHQTRGLGFHEYFQFCEDLGAEPLPVLAAGVPCQNSDANADSIGGQQGGIPMEKMPEYIQDVLDLIEYANGDALTTEWGKLRAENGHPAPFGLKMIGIGNEDLVSTVFEQRYLLICEAVREKYPEIEIIGTVGPFHYPSSDYIEGWRIAKENRDIIDAVDEHYYESTGWFLHNQNYYDDYDRTAPKVYLGEYASGTRTMESALAEAIHLCNIERNGDVVEMTSYAPLFCHKQHVNWNPDMIYFDGHEGSLELTPSYQTQRIFGNHAGDTYISSSIGADGSYSYRIAASVVSDSKTGKSYLKVVNALPRTLRLNVEGLPLPETLSYEKIEAQPSAKAVQLGNSDDQMGGHALLKQNNTLVVPAYSVNVIEL